MCDLSGSNSADVFRTQVLYDFATLAYSKLHAFLSAPVTFEVIGASCAHKRNSNITGSFHGQRYEVGHRRHVVYNIESHSTYLEARRISANTCRRG